MTVWASALLALAALGMFCAAVAVATSNSSANSAPTHVGRYQIVWARSPTGAPSLECFEARSPPSSRSGVWLGG